MGAFSLFLLFLGANYAIEDPENTIAIGFFAVFIFLYTLPVIFNCGSLKV
jgi:hypothetical protein